jgi:hypothetical protein
MTWCAASDLPDSRAISRSTNDWKRNAACDAPYYSTGATRAANFSDLENKLRADLKLARRAAVACGEVAWSHWKRLAAVVGFAWPPFRPFDLTTESILFKQPRRAYPNGTVQFFSFQFVDVVMAIARRGRVALHPARRNQCVAREL